MPRRAQVRRTKKLRTSFTVKDPDTGKKIKLFRRPGQITSNTREYQYGRKEGNLITIDDGVAKVLETPHPHIVARDKTFMDVSFFDRRKKGKRKK